MEFSCPGCGKTKPKTEFHKQPLLKNGIAVKCKKCWAQERTGRLNSTKEKLFLYLLDHPCTDCKENDPLVLDFDHLRDKKDAITRLVKRGFSWKNILTEIDKCEVVCANCHRRRTAERKHSFKIKMLELPGE